MKKKFPNVHKGKRMSFIRKVLGLLKNHVVLLGIVGEVTKILHESWFNTCIDKKSKKIKIFACHDPIYWAKTKSIRCKIDPEKIH